MWKVVAETERVKLLRERSRMKEKSCHPGMPWWTLSVRLQRISHLLRSARKRARQIDLDALLLEVSEAWQRRQTALAHRLSRRIAGTSRGPKKRWHNVPTAARPSCDTWAYCWSGLQPRAAWALFLWTSRRPWRMRTLLCGAV